MLMVSTSCFDLYENIVNLDIGSFSEKCMRLSTRKKNYLNCKFSEMEDTIDKQSQTGHYTVRRFKVMMK